MSEESDPVIVKKYANRRLYHTGISSYVTLEDLADMVRRNEDFVVVDAKTNEDITHSVLTQIIFDEENKGQNMLPISFLRQLISFYGDSLQAFLPSYLEHSLSLFSKERTNLQKNITDAFQPAAMTHAFEEQARQNMALFEKTMRMFTPFADNVPTATTAPEPAAKAGSDELNALKQQIAAMQQQLQTLAERSQKS